MHIVTYITTFRFTCVRFPQPLCSKAKAIVLKVSRKLLFFSFLKYLSFLDPSEAGTRDWCVLYEYQIVFSISHLDVVLHSNFVSCGVFLGNINWTDFVIFPWLLSLQDVPRARWLTWMNSLCTVKNHLLLLFMTCFFHLSCFPIFSLLHRRIVMPDWDETVISSYIRKPYWGKTGVIRTEDISSDSSYFNFQCPCSKNMWRAIAFKVITLSLLGCL